MPSPIQMASRLEPVEAYAVQMASRLWRGIPRFELLRVSAPPREIIRDDQGGLARRRRDAEEFGVSHDGNTLVLDAIDLLPPEEFPVFLVD